MEACRDFFALHAYALHAYALHAFGRLPLRMDVASGLVGADCGVVRCRYIFSWKRIVVLCSADIFSHGRN